MENTSLFNTLKSQYPNFFKKGDIAAKTICVALIQKHLTSLQDNKPQAFLKAVTYDLNSGKRTHLTQSQFKILSSVFKHINTSTQLGLPYPPCPVKPHRPSNLPNNTNEWMAQEDAYTLLEQLKKSSLRKALNNDDIANIICYVFTELGYGIDPAINFLSRLRQGDLRKTILPLPVHYLAPENACHTLQVPEALQEIFQKLYRFNKRNKTVQGRGQHAQWAISIATEEYQNPLDEHKERFKKIKTLIQKNHSRLINRFYAPDNPHYQTLKKFTSFCNSLRLSSLLNLGIPNAFYNQLNQLPLPVDGAAGLSQFIALPEIANYQVPPSSHRSKNVHHAKYSFDEFKTANLIEYEDEDEAAIIPAWLGLSHQTLDYFMEHLKICYPQNLRLRTSEDKGTLQTFAQKLIDSMSSHLPPYSIALLAIHWITTELIERKINPNTANKYLRTVIINGILNYEASDNIEDWDEEDLICAKNTLTNNRKLAETTRLDRERRMLQFLAFCQNLGLLGNITLVSRNTTSPRAFYRNHIWTPGDFQRHYESIKQSGHPFAEKICIVLALAYWGGLRSKEILNISLSSIQVCLDEVNILILSSKTPSGRRKVPIHLLAPEYVLHDLKKFIAKRKELTKNLEEQTKEISLLGPDEKKEAYQREGFITPLIEFVRFYAGPHFDLHSLRHSFASLTLLRWFLLKRPKHLTVIRLKNNEIFSSAAVNKFTCLFGCGADSLDAQTSIDHLIIIRKLIGHSHISITLEHYVHIFGVLLFFIRKDKLRD